MRVKCIKYLVIINVVFICTQIPLTLLTQKKLNFPSTNFSKIRNGEYGQELEEFFKTNSYLSEVSSKTYKAFLGLFFKRSSKHVLIGKKDFLFLKERTVEVDKVEAEKASLDAQNYLISLNELLRKSGINFILLTLPNRSRVYKDFAYKNKKIPEVRRNFYPQLISKLKNDGVKVIDMNEHMIKYEHNNEHVFFRVDHHWTWKYVHFASPYILSEIERLSGESLLSPREMYTYQWEEKVNAHDKIARKLGYNKNFIPNKFKEVQLVPKFNINKDDYASDAEDKVMIISSSYGRYGVVQNLSNLIGEYLPFYIGRGKGPTYGMTQLVMDHLIPNKNIPKTVVWILSEFELYKLNTGSVIPSVISPQSLSPISFKIENVEAADLVNNKLTHDQGVMNFQIKLNKKFSNIIIKMKVNSKKLKSTMTINDKMYDLVHTGIDLFYKVKINADTLNIQIRTPYIKKAKNKRTFEVLGIYTENE